jgi:hypothetical protein
MPMLRLADQVDQVQLVKGSKTEWKRRKGSVSAAQHQGSVTDAYINFPAVAVFAIGQDAGRRIKQWYDTPTGRHRALLGR